MDKYLLKTVKALEALNILKESDYRQFENKRVEITKDIFNSIRSNSKPKTKEAEGIAYVYLRRFRYPFYTSLSKYEPLDLMLALNHHYLNDLGFNFYQLSDVNISMTQANTIAKALFEDFDPTAIPTDLESKSFGRIGEFKRYVGKGHIFHIAVEGKRSGQYAALGLPNYYDSVRYAVIQSELAKLSAERLKRLEAQLMNDTETQKKTAPEALSVTDTDDLEIIEVDVPAEAYDDEFTDDSNNIDDSSFVYDGPDADDNNYVDYSSQEFDDVGSQDFEDVESVDIDDPTKPDDDEWTKI